MIRIKTDIAAALKAAGWSSYRLEHSQVISNGAMTQLRAGRAPGPKVLDKICTLLRCQPGDLLEWVPDPDDSSSTKKEGSLISPPSSRHGNN